MLKGTWLTSAGLALALMAPAAHAFGTTASAQPAAAAKAAEPKAKKTKAKKPKAAKAVAKAVPKKKTSPRPLAPSKPPADIPKVEEAASVWRGCLEAGELPKLASGLGVEESKLEPLLAEQGVLGDSGCVPYVAATGGQGGSASALFQRPSSQSGEGPILDIRKTSDGITVTPGACDCPEPVARIVEFPAEDTTGRFNEFLSTVPGNIRWELEILVPQMVARFAAKQGPQEAPSSEGSPHTVRIALAHHSPAEPEHLQAIEVVETATGRRVDGAWWLERPGNPGVLIGMEGPAYERLLWLSPVHYVSKSRGVGPAASTYRRTVTVQKDGTKTKTTKYVTVREYHIGADLLAPKGTEVHAVGDAKVAFAGRMGGYGNLIILDHGLGYQTYYAHLSVIKPLIHVGAEVSRGDVIGLVGSTGHSTAPHLHFETRKDSKYIDPFDDSRQLEFWMLTPDDQERLAMEMLVPPATPPSGSPVIGEDSADRK